MKILFLEIPTASEYMTFIIVKTPLPFTHSAQRQNRFSEQNGVVKGISQVRSWHWLTYPGFRAPQAIGRPCTTRQLSRSESRPPQPQADNHPPGRGGWGRSCCYRDPQPRPGQEQAGNHHYVYSSFSIYQCEVIIDIYICNVFCSPPQEWVNDTVCAICDQLL